MKKEWFVLQALTGQENKVLKSIVARAKQQEMGEYIGDCIIPMEKVTENKNGKKRVLNKKVFPGYVLIVMALYDDTGALDENGKLKVVVPTWQFIRETPGVIGSWLMQYPKPLTGEEVNAILSTKPAQGTEKPRPTVTFTIGEMVKIVDGAFMGMKGQISVDDPDRGRVRVEVHVFNRFSPVDLDYWQVEKIPEEELQAEPES